jgi:choline dehydrogenase-like flavoprotein
VKLTRRQRSLLEAVCATFAPGGGAAEADAVLAELDGDQLRRADRLRVLLALTVLASRPATAAAGEGLRRFDRLSAEARERVLLRWARSRAPSRRALFHGLRRLVVGAAYAAEPAARPRWEAIGYPGPPGRVQAPPARLGPVAARGGLGCDVVVVGSGAGGGPAAAVLAQAGLDVIVVEAGGLHDAPEFDGGEVTGHRLLYRSIPVEDLAIGMVAGWCVGGGTLVNNASCFRTPEPLREEWGGLYREAAYGAALEEVWERLGVTTAESRPSPRDLALRRGLEALGWHAGVTPRNVRGCEQGLRCGFCGAGCPFRAKQSTLHTWLEDADAAGARLVPDTFVERIDLRAGAVVGVTATDDSRIAARAVVCAAGAVQTPALLRRSGLGNAELGRNLRLHPSTFVFGVLDEPVEPWGGTTQAVYSSELGDLDGRGHGVRYATVPLHPGFLARTAPWGSAAGHERTMRELARTVCVVLQVQDRDGGEVAVLRSGQPLVRFRLSARDREHVRAGVAGAARILEAAGARELYTAHGEPCRARGAAGLVERADALGYEPGRLAYGSVHVMGSAGLGTACDPLGRVPGAGDVVVCDGSLLPSAPGVNPMVTIEATALVVARALAARL